MAGFLVIPKVYAVIASPFRWYFDSFLGPRYVKKTIFASMNQYFIDELSIFLTEVHFDT